MNVLVVYCHPDPTSFTAAIRDATVETLTSAGHTCASRDLYASGFDPKFTRRGVPHPPHGAGPPRRCTSTPTELRECEHLVLVYPTWWSGQPAMLKGWIDRVWVRGVAWDLPAGANRVKARLTNVRRLTAITTHGSSKWVNVLEGEGGKRTVTRSLRALCHPWRARTGSRCTASTPRRRSERDAFIGRVRKKLSRV